MSEPMPQPQPFGSRMPPGGVPPGLVGVGPGFDGEDELAVFKQAFKEFVIQAKQLGLEGMVFGGLRKEIYDRLRGARLLRTMIANLPTLVPRWVPANHDEVLTVTARTVHRRVRKMAAEALVLADSVEAHAVERRVSPPHYLSRVRAVCAALETQF